MKAEKEICQIGGRAFEGRENSLCKFMEPQKHIPGKKEEGLQRKETELGRAVGLVYNEPWTPGESWSLWLFSLGWLVWASYVAVVEQWGRGFLPLIRCRHCVTTFSSVLMVTSSDTGSPAHSSAPLLKWTLSHHFVGVAFMQMLTSDIYSQKLDSQNVTL